MEIASMYDLPINNINEFDNQDFFYKVKSSIDKFDSIFIDEIQDYKQEWLNLIINYFTHEDTELIVFGDEKQNIYERELDENKEIKITKIPGRWTRSLKKS